MNKYKYLKNLVKESLEELVTDFNDFDSFNNSLSDGTQHCFVYNEVHSDAKENIERYGTLSLADFYNTMVNGRGLYGVLTFEEGRRTGEGNMLVKYIAKKGAFNNFLFFDKESKNMLLRNGGLTEDKRLSEKLVELLPDYKVREIEQRYGSLAEVDRIAESGTYSAKSLQSSILNIMREGEGSIRYNRDRTYHSEKLLDECDVDGWVYRDGYGHTFVCRTLDLFIPYAYMMKGYNGFSNSESDFIPFHSDSSNFDNINHSIDAFRRHRKNYPDTTPTEKTVCGFSLVRKGDKYNLVNATTNKIFSPVDFDYCTKFETMNNSASFKLVLGAKEMNFTVTSNDFGNDLNLSLTIKNAKTGELIGENPNISYDKFYQLMLQVKSIKEKGATKPNRVNEAFTKQSRDEFYNSYDNGDYQVHLYRATNSESTLKSMINGISNDFSGTGGDKSMYYGQGTYWVRSKDSLLTEKYGNYVVDCVLKDGYKNFLICDDELRQQWYPGYTVYDQILELCPPEVINELERILKDNSKDPFRGFVDNLVRGLKANGLKEFAKNNAVDGSYWKFGKTRGDSKIKQTATIAKKFHELSKGEPLKDSPLGDAVLCDEILFAKTKIRGYVFTGTNDGEVVVVKNPNDLMPVGYSTDGGQTFETVRHDEATFNRINTNVNPYQSYRAEYNKIGMLEKQNCGFSCVNGSNGGNFIDVYDHRKLLPVNADKVMRFNEIDNSAYFELGGELFRITVLGDDVRNCSFSLSCKDGNVYEDIDYNTFIEYVQDCIQNGWISKRQFFNDAILNQNNC